MMNMLEEAFLELTFDISFGLPWVGMPFAMNLEGHLL